MKERLIELIKSSSQYVCEDAYLVERIADRLLANGVVVVDTNKVSAKNRPLITHIAGYTINEVIDLMEAKNAGRVVELPCAVGDYVEWDNGLIKTLYCVMGYMCDDAGFRFILNDFAPVINHRNITRTLTREEAEKALERSEGK